MRVKPDAGVAYHFCFRTIPTLCRSREPRSPRPRYHHRAMPSPVARARLYLFIIYSRGGAVL
jgi:hypothetical protein